MGAWVGSGVFPGGSGLAVGTPTGVAVGSSAVVAVPATATVGGTVASLSDSESAHAAIAMAKAHIREMDTAQAKLGTWNLK